MRLKAIFTLAIFAVLTSCYYDNEEELYQNFEQPCDVSSVTYSQDVNIIVAENCALSGCHVNPGAQAGLDLTTYQGVSANAASIQNRINLAPGAAGKMPPTGQLNDCDLEKLNTWIDQGALNN